MIQESQPSLRFSAIGTEWEIDIYEAADLQTLERAEVFAAVEERIEAFDFEYSRFRKDSWVQKIAQAAGEYALPADGFPLFDISQRLYTCTDGAFTPLVGAVLEDLGYDAEYSLQERAIIRSTPVWDERFTFDCQHITVREPVLFDFGAAGKGYLVDIVSQVLEEYGVTAYCVNASGDMKYRAPKNPKNTDPTALRIGLENPLQQGEVIGITPLFNESICASAGNRRAWGKHHHIIHGTTHQSPTEIVGTWVKAPDAVVADAVATALFLVPPAVLQADFSFEYLIMYHDKRVQRSAGFAAELFTKGTS